MDGRARDALRTHLRIATCYNLLMREARQRVGSRWKLTPDMRLSYAFDEREKLSRLLQSVLQL